jgi:hypothetical protein
MSTDATQPSSGREPNGLFAKGNTLSKGVGGNPNVKRQAALKKAFIECVTEEDVRKLYASLLAAALGGDTQSARLIMDHALGKPVQVLEVTGTEGEPVTFNMAAFVGVIQTALADHPEAQYKLAAALKGAKLDGPDGPD